MKKLIIFMLISVLAISTFAVGCGSDNTDIGSLSISAEVSE